MQIHHEVKEILFRHWVPWAIRRVGPNGYCDQTIEYMMMIFGTARSRGSGEDADLVAERLEGEVCKLPPELRKIIIVECVARDEAGRRYTRDERAKLAHKSKSQYYKQLERALTALWGTEIVQQLRTR